MSPLHFSTPNLTPLPIRNLPLVSSWRTVQTRCLTKISTSCRRTFQRTAGLNSILKTTMHYFGKAFRMKQRMKLHSTELGTHIQSLSPSILTPMRPPSNVESTFKTSVYSTVMLTIPQNSVSLGMAIVGTLTSLQDWCRAQAISLTRTQSLQLLTQRLIWTKHGSGQRGTLLDQRIRCKMLVDPLGWLFRHLLLLPSFRHPRVPLLLNITPMPHTRLRSPIIEDPPSHLHLMTTAYQSHTRLDGAPRHVRISHRSAESVTNDFCTRTPLSSTFVFTTRVMENPTSF